ncbi:G/U mismatch-specific DNA glycosylase [Amycolatopsis acidiphila]|uniref:G/U mismatch-specific DNA glycosylase n=1 Tax=Amycolatopsis acidiphila TaxID=715473 RepID=A0A558ALG4_9PSEU|nr:G/U mismatch-specific DNA glycosylase [Amycolatopsis acidiphila]TVT25090.1 G/U mismatch-specific DNA glycosylase [Amycolatopsis acidiphila]UIJ57398.1 G/U mismatch-specific DNA glycosylase [Amycolatopsis acidiphila]
MTRRYSRAELDAGRETRLPDLVAPNLRVLLVGINPGLSSAVAGRHFATPGNRLWPALHRSGFTPRLLTPEEDEELLGLGIGITSLVARPTVRASELTRDEYVEGGRRLRETVLALRPQWLAPLGVTGYRAAFGVRDAAVGLREESVGATRIWILPNPSGLNAHYPPLALAREFARLRVAAGMPDRSGVLSPGGAAAGRERS